MNIGLENNVRTISLPELIPHTGGAGTLSSPVLAEHPKNVSECAMYFERTVGSLAMGAPQWLLVSLIGIATRELASRRFQDNVLPTLVTGTEAQPKARRVAQQMRRNLDDRIQRMLQPAGYGSAERLVSRFVDAEIDELQGTITSLDDVVSNEVTQAVSIRLLSHRLIDAG